MMLRLTLLALMAVAVLAQDSTTSPTACQVDSDCMLFNLDEGCCAACAPVDLSQDNWVSVNADWYNGMRNEKCSAVMCPMYYCMNKMIDGNWAPACSEGVCAKIATAGSDPSGDGKPHHGKPHSDDDHKKPHSDDDHKKPHSDDDHKKPHSDDDHKKPHSDDEHKKPHQGKPKQGKPNLGVNEISFESSASMLTVSLFFTLVLALVFA
eukprot:TRINITY_DN67_c0_g1_i1.p2 TRINITY_DN67_c0_g1~~TRINITY_DN67_c0_g1_i1.p2  ORF type:complete len:224 (+),score=95.80 TRINITY_DN67_c0_g1_i1:51-674(+)